MNLKVFIVDDHQLFIDGISAILNGVIGVDVIGCAHNGFEFLKFLESNVHPDIVMMDIRMPIMDGIMTTRVLTKEYPQIKVLALSMYDQKQDVKEMLDAGAKGYLVKNSGKKEMLEAINAIHKKKTYISSALASKVEDIDLDTRSEHVKPLTRREKEILRLIAKGRTSHQIASELSISKMTVDTHRKNIHKKLGISSSVGLLKYALKV